MTDPTKRPKGRPLGTTKGPEPADQRLTVFLPKATVAWIKTQPRGWLPALLNGMAHKK
jgi:hypothetical protein